MATRKRKGRGAPGKAKSAAHREALSKALKAFHAGKRGKKSSGTKRRSTRRKETKTDYQKREMKKIRRLATTDRVLKRSETARKHGTGALKRKFKPRMTSAGRKVNMNLMLSAKRERNKRRAMGL